MPLNHKKSDFSTGFVGELREKFLGLKKYDDFQLEFELKQEVSLRI